VGKQAAKGGADATTHGLRGECDWLSLRGGGRRGRRTTAEERERWRQKKERGNVDTHT
jgi:hypothetical protein